MISVDENYQTTYRFLDQSGWIEINLKQTNDCEFKIQVSIFVEENGKNF